MGVNGGNTIRKKPTNRRGGSFIRRAMRIVVRHTLLAGGALACAGLLFLLTIDRIVMPVYQRYGKEISAPDLRGMPLEEARNLVKNRRLGLSVEAEEFSAKYPVNTISFQLPSSGTVIKPGRRMRVKVSLGAVPYMVPDVVGKSPRDARQVITEAGLRVAEEGWIPSNDYPMGIVARQSPVSGSEVAENTGITIFISNGKPVTDTIMPSLIHMSLSAARDTLRVRRFNPARLRVEYEVQPELLPETVIEQYPDPGAPVNTNGEIVLIVSRREEEPER